MKFETWKIPYGPPDIPRQLTAAGYSPLLAALLGLRGYADPGDAASFIRGGPELMGNPLLLTDMPMAVGRIARALQAGETLAVYGDYDVDGITSACLLTDYLRSRGARCEMYIPDRVEEGYGLNAAAIDALAAKGVTLLITVDCGVTASREAAYAASLGMDMIITDHHECQGALPEAVAVIDPKRDDCNYPSRSLAGVGVAFKLVCAIEGDARKILRRYADLVAVGTVADVMPLTGENRYIIREGLCKLCSDPRPGLLALMEEAGVSDKRLTAVTIGFTLAPRLNAAGRLCQAATAAELLMAQERQLCRTLAAKLCSLNRDRQALEQETWGQAVELLGDGAGTLPIVLAAENWHQGVIGIAASRLAEAFSVPAVMICLDGELGKGSCRSCKGFNLYDALSACSEYLESFGGHDLAAGLTIRRDRVDDFRRAFGEYYLSHPAARGPQLEAELLVCDPVLLEMPCVEAVELMEPFGSGNPRPQICLTDAMLESVTPIGGGRHLRLRLMKFGRFYDCVFFSATEPELGLRPGDRADAVFYPQINEFRGRRSVQLLLIDIRRHDPTPVFRALVGGEIPGGDLSELLPDRRDFAAVWRKLTALGGSVTGGIRDTLARLAADGMSHERVGVCLCAFAQLDLAELTVTDTELTAVLRGWGEKVELTDSPLLQGLTRAAGERQ